MRLLEKFHRRPHLEVVGGDGKPRRLWSGPSLAILLGVIGTAAVLVGLAWWRSSTAADRDDLAGTTVEAVDGLGTANARLTDAGLPPVAVAPTLAESATSAASVVGTPPPTSVVTVTERAPTGRPTGFPVPGPTVTVTGPDGVVTVTSTETRLVVGPGGTTTVTETRTSTAPAADRATVTETTTTTAPAPPPVTVEVPVEVPGPVTTVEVPGPVTTVTEPGPTVTVTEAGPTVTVTQDAPPPDPDPEE